MMPSRVETSSGRAEMVGTSMCLGGVVCWENVSGVHRTSAANRRGSERRIDMGSLSSAHYNGRVVRGTCLVHVRRSRVRWGDVLARNGILVIMMKWGMLSSTNAGYRSQFSAFATTT